MGNVTKIGFITNMYTPYKEAMFREINRLVDLKVYYCSAKERDRDWDVEFSETYPYEFLSGKTFHLNRYKLHCNRGLRKAIKQDKLDLMIVGEWSKPTVIYAPFLLRAMGVPRILWSGSTHGEAAWQRKFTYLLKRLIVAQYHGYVTYTTFARDYVASLGAPRDRITVAPVTVDTDFFRRKADALKASPGRKTLREKIGLNENDIGIVFVGQMIPRKGVDILLQALAKIKRPNVKAILAGSGSAMECFQRMAKELGIANQVTFLGHCTQEQLVELYVAGNIFTLPSRQEPSGNVINEAMCVGLPAVISDQVGCDCLKENKTGHFFESENVDDYVAKLLHMIDDSVFRRTAGEAAYDALRGPFSIQMEAHQFAKAVQLTLTQLKRKFVPKVPIDSFINENENG